MSIQSLPPELLTQIIALTPTSFPSVSVLSRSFHSLSASFALNTLQVSGLDSIRRLASLLESDKAQAESEGRVYVGRVKHIFLSDVAPETANVPGIDDILRCSNSNVGTEAHGLLQAYSALLPLLTPSLVSLTVLSYNPYITPYRVILETPFPRLQSLTMRFTAIPYVVDFDACRTPTMPSLTHFHLAFAASPTLSDEPVGLVRMAAICAPNLTEVKFTNVRLGRDTVPILRKMLNISRAGKMQRFESMLTLFEEAQGEQAAPQPDADSNSDAQTEVETDVDSDEATDVEDEGGDNHLGGLATVYVQPALPSIDIPWWASYQLEMLQELKALSRETVHEAVTECVGRHRVGKEKGYERRRELIVLDSARRVGGYREWRRKWFAGVGWEPDFGMVYGCDGDVVKGESVCSVLSSPVQAFVLASSFMALRSRGDVLIFACRRWKAGERLARRRLGGCIRILPFGVTGAFSSSFCSMLCLPKPNMMLDLMVSWLCSRLALVLRSSIAIAAILCPCS
ncbi:hypothetical protein NEOLEDRAFT_814639 [Neolentinus lepideus HHB14362 ss-1]|uniref:F-box domain-containing protein n=1 Tax=Neolentinus lepideus HHB14362 ss-1 TaxID=1314782 RepID=A0A165PCK6_9AGAM|nr:hypothetical protein NEOLEDRAFT_814639 [Neolentinus lepideus HHB14362 ss-1]